MNGMNDVKEIHRDLSGQITTIPKPEFFRIPLESPPFGVTNRRFGRSNLPSPKMTSF